MLVQEPIQKIQMIQDNFSPNETEAMVHAMIDRYINFYKLQFMRNWEADHEFDSSDIDGKIELLRALKKDIPGTIRQARREGCTLSLEGLLTLNPVR